MFIVISVYLNSHKAQSWNEQAGKLESKAVLNAFRKNTKQIVQIQLADKLIETTPDHPFYVQSKGWVETGKLNINDKLFDEEHKLVSIVSLKIVDETVPVYNLEIEDNHTYFAHGILVHNISCKAHIGNKTYTIIDGKKVFDEKGKELTPVQIYELYLNNRENRTQDLQGIAYALDRDELFQILDYYGDWAKDPMGENRKNILKAINVNIMQSGVPLTESQSKIFTQSAIAADMSFLTTGLAITGSPVQGNKVPPQMKQLPSSTAGTTFAQIGSLEGKSLGQISRIVNNYGFTYRGPTAGGYQKFYGAGNGSSRMEIQIRPNGQVVRYQHTPNGTVRYDQSGNVTTNHNSGETTAYRRN